MLNLLTGDIQTGKTRWLNSLIDQLANKGVISYGVLAPGVWVPSSTEHADENGFEKLGIDNVLLPTGERVHLANRGDIARAHGLNPDSAKGAAKSLRWHFDEDAVKQVNEYLATVPTMAAQHSSSVFLVIDEIGPLEFAGEGLTNAMMLLDAGPQGPIKNAIVVVREALLEKAEERFAPAWGSVKRILPDDAPRAGIIQQLSEEAAR